MDLVYAIPLIALLAIVWAAVRHAANKARRRREALREQRRRSRMADARAPYPTSQRSDMRRTDSPITVVDSIQKPGPRSPESAEPPKPTTER